MKRVVAKRILKTKTPPATPVGRVLEMKPSRMGMHHGLTLGTIILFVVVAGSLTFAGLEYKKADSASAAAQSAVIKLAQSAAQNVDLAQRLKDNEALNALAAKAPPKEIFLKTYSSPNLSLDYPEDFTIVKATNDFPVLTINNKIGGVLIFRSKDFSNPVPQDYSIIDKAMAGTNFYGDNFTVAKTTISVPDNPKAAPYDVWTVNGINDAAAKAVLDKIVASIKVIK
jgi:hypothetical protein